MLGISGTSARRLWDRMRRRDGRRRDAFFVQKIV